MRCDSVDVVIEAFRLLAAEFPEIDLLIAGDGPQRGELEVMIAASQLQSRIHLLSSLAHSELWSLYKGALMFIMLSRMAEGLPLVFFEAMACSIPMIGTRNGGTPISCIRVIALGASFVWSVLKTKCPVNEAWTAISAVS